MAVNADGAGRYKRREFVLPENHTAESEPRNALRLSNEESNRLTRESIEEALVLLMKDSDFASISITDIIKKAGVARSSYYRNYSSKEEILTNVFNSAAETIVSALSPELAELNMLNSYRILFEKVLENRRLFEIILMADLGDRFQMTINDKYLHAIDASNGLDYYRLLSWIGSIFNIILGWIHREYRETPGEMAHICTRFLREEEWLIGAKIKWNDAGG